MVGPSLAVCASCRTTKRPAKAGKAGQGGASGDAQGSRSRAFEHLVGWQRTLAWACRYPALVNWSYFHIWISMPVSTHSRNLETLILLGELEIEYWSDQTLAMLKAPLAVVAELGVKAKTVVLDSNGWSCISLTERGTDAPASRALSSSSAAAGANHQRGTQVCPLLQELSPAVAACHSAL